MCEAVMTKEPTIAASNAMAAFACIFPTWFDDYGYKPSAYYDDHRASHETLNLGSVGGDKATFCQHGFETIGGAPAVQFVIPIPVIHATLQVAAGYLWVFGLATSMWCWQGPIPGVVCPIPSGKAAPAAMPTVLAPAQHHTLPKKYGHVFNQLWEEVAVPHYRMLGRRDLITAAKAFDFTKHEPRRARP